MTTLFLIIFLTVLAAILVIGGVFLRFITPADHLLQRYISKSAVSAAIKWSIKNIRLIAGFSLAFVFF